MQATVCGGILVRRLHVMVSTEPASIEGMRYDVLIVASYDTVDKSNWLRVVSELQDMR